MRRALAAGGSLALLAAAGVLAVIAAARAFPSGLAVLLCLALALLAAGYAVTHRGVVRLAWLAGALLLLAGAVAVLVAQGVLLLNLLVAGAVAASVLAAGVAFRVHVELPRAERPRRAVLFYNPKSGGGKAERFALADEARRRGIEPIELRPGEDLEQLVRAAVARGADALAMAGGDGSQAVVAMVAAQAGLPYACVPAGTRNHFALDLGVDRADVVGALDAFVSGGERQVDLAEVNGRVFVNNVSLGLYGEAVQQAGYRDAKLRTLLDAVPSSVGPEASAPYLTWSERGGRRSAIGLLISNNRYRLEPGVGSGTRPRLDGGVLGIAALEGPAQPEAGLAPRVRQWEAPSFELVADRPVPAGIDGEAAVLEPPLEFRVRPGALRVRIAPGHPGASPSALVPRSPAGILRALAGFTVGRGPGRPSDARR